MDEMAQNMHKASTMPLAAPFSDLKVVWVCEPDQGIKVKGLSRENQLV